MLKSPRHMGAITYSVAAVLTGIGALVLSGDDLGPKIVREVAPLALIVGAVAGYMTVSAWPQNLSRGAWSGCKTALGVLGLFCAIYLVGDAIIETVRGGDTITALADASGRLLTRLPAATVLAVLTFSTAGAVLWSIRPRAKQA